MGYKRRMQGGITLFENENGVTLGMRNPRILEADGCVFKDLSGSGELLPYEDWRLSAGERAKDLAGRLSVDEIAGLMLYSSHQLVPFRSMGPFQGHYNGKEYEEGMDPWVLTDEQKRFLEKDNIRHVLLMKVDDAETSAKWSNELQALAESLPWGIPVNISSDPRHGASEGGAEFKSAGKDVSKWPEGIGMTATFSEELCRKYAEAVSKEYRALGITTALGPQVDLATEPRWMRYEDTFGGHLTSSVRMAQLVCDGFQTTEGSEDGWGKDSIVAMAKHWPGGGTGEAGRDAHYAFGKYAVYPGESFDTHMKVFTEGALALEGPTGKAAAIMPYYTISWNQDVKNGKNVGNSYSEYLIKDLLRERYGYDGVVCTDWGITGDPQKDVNSFGSRCYGVEDLSEAERHLQIIMNGVDQFGGNNAKAPILEAYAIGCERYGEKTMRCRMEESARRLLVNMFRLGLFENPYLDPQESKRIVGCGEFVTNGLMAQRASVVMLKNRGDALPLKKGIRVYVPNRQIGPGISFFRTPVPGYTVTPVSSEQAEPYFLPVGDPSEADAAIVFVESPHSDGYSSEDLEQGGNGYLPLSLQYRPYTASYARKKSIAGGDFRERDENRSYAGKRNTCSNESDLDAILDTRKAMGDKPVIVCMRVHNPAVVKEFEKEADGLLVEFGVEKRAVLDVIFGDFEPRGRLPVIMPADMETVETHFEDVFDDIAPHIDEAGHSYRFGYGMNWKGEMP